MISRLLKGRRTSCSGDFNKNLANRKRICEEKSRACKFRFHQESGVNGRATVAVSLFAQTEHTNCTAETIKAMASSAASQEVFEILTLDIKPGSRDEFHEVYVNQSVPLLKKWNFDIVAYGPSLHDANSCYVIRRFKNLKDREKSEDAFYYQRRLGVRPSRRHYGASRAFCLCGRFCREVEESVRGNHTGRHERKNERRTVIDRDDLAQSRTITSTRRPRRSIGSQP